MISFIKKITERFSEKKVPNLLDKEIRQLIECQYLLTEEQGDPKFEAPCSENEISEWEGKTGICVPADYKEWLKFTGSCRFPFYYLSLHLPILKSDSGFAEFDEFPDDLVIIGEWIGDGELICFSKDNGKIYTFYDGDITDRGTFREFINRYIEDMRNEICEENTIDEAYKEEMDELLNRL